MPQRKVIDRYSDIDKAYMANPNFEKQVDLNNNYTAVGNTRGKSQWRDKYRAEVGTVRVSTRRTSQNTHSMTI